MRTLSLIFFVVFCLVHWSNVQTLDPIGLKVSAELRGFRLGAAILVNYLRNQIDQGQYNSHLIQNYQLIVPGAELKPQHIWIGRHNYNFVDSDWLLGATPDSIGWVQENNMHLRGHTLIWAYDMRLPKWLLAEESIISPNDAKNLLSDYIHAVVGRYKGKIQWWDVINELISDYPNTRPFHIRDSLWYRKLGIDFVKYAYQFAHEADPDALLYYNDYGIEAGGFKANQSLSVIDWLQSQGVPIHGFGMQWHKNLTEAVTPGDAHYQNAQQFINRNISFMITELDVAIPMKDDQPIDPQEFDKQGALYRSVLELALHFYPQCPALLTWGVTDRYSWIPAATNDTEGDALPLDKNYQPKSAYLQMQEVLARVVDDGFYRLSPVSQSDSCLGVNSNSSSSTVQLFTGICNDPHAQWNVTWQNDGTYRVSPKVAINSALSVYNTTTTGYVFVSSWTEDATQEWVITSQGKNVYRFGPRTAWERVLAVDETSHIVVTNYTMDPSQQWLLTRSFFL